MIELCNNLADKWSKYFKDFTICIDNSKKNDKYSDYNVFENLNEKGILFCAAKHREGSDIKNLDTCIFLDYVEDRYSQNFVQCIAFRRYLMLKQTES